jgi:hypothetical protein
MLPVAPNILREVQTCLSAGVIACVVSMSLTSPARGQLTQGANTLQFVGSDNPSGSITRTADALISPDQIEIQHSVSDGLDNLSNAGVSIDENNSGLFFIDYTSNYEGLIATYMDTDDSPAPIVMGGVHPYKVNGLEYWDTVTPVSPDGQYTGYVITQSGSTWYGDLTMNVGTTFTADNLVASSITTTSLNATSITAGSLSVTGNTTLGGTLNMSGNRIINVADGVDPTDAVNVRQLQLNQRESRAGIASVAAIAGIPTLSTTDDAVLGVGVGTFKGESSIAVGASKRFSDSTAIKFGVGANSSTGDVTGSFGIGIKW